MDVVCVCVGRNMMEHRGSFQHSEATSRSLANGAVPTSLAQQKEVLDLWLALSQQCSVNDVADVVYHSTERILPRHQSALMFVLDGDVLRSCGSQGPFQRVPLGTGLAGRSASMATVGYARRGECVMLFLPLKSPLASRKPKEPSNSSTTSVLGVLVLVCPAGHMNSPQMKRRDSNRRALLASPLMSLRASAKVTSSEDVDAATKESLGEEALLQV